MTKTTTMSLPAVLTDIDELIRPVARRLQENHMSCLGIADTMRVAHGFNMAKFGRQDEQRRELYQGQLANLLDENTGPKRPLIELNDGWAIDRTMSLPHLERVLEDSEEIIAERSGARRSAQGAYRSYFQDVWTSADLERFPSFLDFATSSEVLAVVADYLKCIPVLSATVPSGIRFVESNAAFDDQPDRPHDSQLYHIDYYSLPNVYLLVLLRDTMIEHGPWTFLPRSASQKAAKALNYWQRGRPYRLSDEEIYSVVEKREAIEFCAPRGTVLFIESSGCFHYGSRNSIEPRFQLMLGYTGVCRTDFADTLMTSRGYPIRDADSRLRQMVLNRSLPT
jgi:hypothetical protein